jgi:hypothetical protein
LEPDRKCSLQASWADITSPEALEPEHDEERWSVSGIYTRPIGGDAFYSVDHAGVREQGAQLMACRSMRGWRKRLGIRMRSGLGSRAAEAIETDELAAHHGPVEDVARLSGGVIRDWRVNENTVFGVGAVLQQHFASDALEPLYDGDPQGAMGFVRLKIG